MTMSVSLLSFHFIFLRSTNNNKNSIDIVKCLSISFCLGALANNIRVVIVPFRFA